MSTRVKVAIGVALVAGFAGLLLFLRSGRTGGDRKSERGHEQDHEHGAQGGAGAPPPFAGAERGPAPLLPPAGTGGGDVVADTTDRVPPPPPAGEVVKHPEPVPLTGDEEHARWQRAMALLDDRIAATARDLEQARAAGTKERAEMLQVRLERMREHRTKLASEDPRTTPRRQDQPPPDYSEPPEDSPPEQ